MVIAKAPYLDCLTGQRFIWVWYVLHGNAIKLAFVDVRHPVVFTPLVGRDRGFQIIAEPIVGESIHKYDDYFINFNIGMFY